MNTFLFSIIKKLKLSPDDHGLYSLFGKKVAVGLYEKEFYVFSNFSSFQIMYEGKLYPTSEHVYHAMKFTDPEIQEKMRLAISAHEAFYLARDFEDKKRSDWNDVRYEYMKQILRLKVEQHPYVKKKLIASDGLIIIEDSWRDAAWGWGPDRDGQNLLGNAWMEVRSEIMKLN